MLDRIALLVCGLFTISIIKVVFLISQLMWLHCKELVIIIGLAICSAMIVVLVFGLFIWAFRKLTIKGKSILF